MQDLKPFFPQDWQNVSGWESVRSKEYQPMGSPGYGKPTNMKPSDYYDKVQGFDKSPI